MNCCHVIYQYIFSGYSPNDMLTVLDDKAYNETSRRRHYSHLPVQSSCLTLQTATRWQRHFNSDNSKSRGFSNRCVSCVSFRGHVLRISSQWIYNCDQTSSIPCTRFRSPEDSIFSLSDISVLSKTWNSMPLSSAQLMQAHAGMHTETLCCVGYRRQLH